MKQFFEGVAQRIADNLREFVKPAARGSIPEIINHYVISPRDQFFHLYEKVENEVDVAAYAANSNVGVYCILETARLLPEGVAARGYDRRGWPIILFRDSKHGHFAVVRQNFRTCIYLFPTEECKAKWVPIINRFFKATDEDPHADLRRLLEIADDLEQPHGSNHRTGNTP